MRKQPAAPTPYVLPAQSFLIDEAGMLLISVLGQVQRRRKVRTPVPHRRLLRDPRSKTDQLLLAPATTANDHVLGAGHGVERSTHLSQLPTGQSATRVLGTGAYLRRGWRDCPENSQDTTSPWM